MDIQEQVAVGLHISREVGVDEANNLNDMLDRAQPYIYYKEELIYEEGEKDGVQGTCNIVGRMRKTPTIVGMEKIEDLRPCSYHTLLLTH